MGRPDYSWMIQRACRDVDPRVFFPERKNESRGQPASNAEAREICASCAVQEQCLDYALDPPYERHGVWGGKSERERRALRNKRDKDRRR